MTYSSHWLACLHFTDFCFSPPVFTDFSFPSPVWYSSIICYILEYSRLTDVQHFQVHSGGTQPYACIHSPQMPLPSRMPHNVEQSSMWYSRSLLVIHFKYKSVCMSIPNSLAIPSPSPCPLAIILPSVFWLCTSFLFSNPLGCHNFTWYKTSYFDSNTYI